MCACRRRRSRAGSIERLLRVAAFAVSGYSSTAGRTSKPFNPLLGETYELVHAEKGLRAIVEKVSCTPASPAPLGVRHPCIPCTAPSQSLTWLPDIACINCMSLSRCMTCMNLLQNASHAWMTEIFARTLWHAWVLCAQVVHHPTVLAAYGEGRKWTFEGDAEVKSKFWGRSIELTPLGLLKLTFHDGEVFTWNKVLHHSSCPCSTAVLTCLGMKLYCAW